MTKTRELTEFDRIEIIRLKEAGKTVSEIAREMSCAKSTVTYTIQRYKEHHTVVDLHRCGRKKISTPRDQRSLINAVKKDRRMTSYNFFNKNSTYLKKMLFSSTYFFTNLKKVISNYIFFGKILKFI